MLLTSHHHHSLPSPPPGNPTLHPQPIQSLGPSSKDFTVLRAIGTRVHAPSSCAWPHTPAGHTVPFQSASILQAGTFRGQQSFTWSELCFWFEPSCSDVLAGQTPSFPPFRIYRSLSLPYQVLPFLSFSHFSFCFKFKPTTASLLRLWSELEIDRYAISGYKL